MGLRVDFRWIMIDSLTTDDERAAHNTHCLSRCCLTKTAGNEKKKTAIGSEIVVPSESQSKHRFPTPRDAVQLTDMAVRAGSEQVY